MGRFHFDENVIGGVSGELEMVAQVISEVNNKLVDIREALSNFKGYGIENNVKSINEVIVNEIFAKQSIYNGIKVIRDSIKIVGSYSRLAYSGYYTLPDPFANIDNADFRRTVDNYNNDPDVAVAGFVDAAVDGLTFNITFKSDSYIGMEAAVDDVLTNLGYINRNKIKPFIDDVLSSPDDIASIVKKVFPDLKTNTYVNKFLNAIDKASKGVELTNEVIAYFAADYYAVHEYLDIMAESYKGNPDMENVIKKYCDTYDEHFLNAIKQTAVYATEFGFKEITSEVLKTFQKQFGTPVSTIQAVGTAVSIAQKAYNIDDIHSNSMKLQGIEELRNQTHTAFNEAYSTLKSGNYTDEDVERAKNLFDIYKSTLISEYETMIAIEQAKLDKDVNPLSGSFWNKQYRDERNARYESVVSEYYAKIEELNNMTNPITLVC